MQFNKPTLTLGGCDGVSHACNAARRWNLEVSNLNSSAPGCSRPHEVIGDPNLPWPRETAHGAKKSVGGPGVVGRDGRSDRPWRRVDRRGCRNHGRCSLLSGHLVSEGAGGGYRARAVGCALFDWEREPSRRCTGWLAKVELVREYVGAANKSWNRVTCMARKMARDRTGAHKRSAGRSGFSIVDQAEGYTLRARCHNQHRLFASRVPDPDLDLQSISRAPNSSAL